MTLLTRSLLDTVLLLLLATSPAPAALASPHATFLQTSFQFEKVRSGAVFEHDFVVKNEGDVALRILRVEMTSPLLVTRMPALVAPGTEAQIRIRLDTSGLHGRFQGEIHVLMNDPDLPDANLSFAGEIVLPVEFLPAPAFFVGAHRGEARQASIEIINHEPEPLRIDEIRHARDRFTTTLETVEEGQRYRLTLLLKPDGPGGRHSEPIELKTSSPSQPMITLAANTYLHERVYTFPDAVDLGTLRLSELERDSTLLQKMAQTLMVYQFGGKDFRVSIRTDLPKLKISSERGPQQDRYQTIVSIVKEDLEAGAFLGSIFIETNDPEFPSLVVPVSGNILP